MFWAIAVLLALAPEPAVRDTPWVGPDVPRPTARYGSYAAACDSVRAVVTRALGAYADSAVWSRGTTSFLYRDRAVLERTGRGKVFWSVGARDSETTVPCLRMTLASRLAAAPGYSTIEQALLEAGWAHDPSYGADGPDGTHFALVCAEALCDVEAAWDGGDDSDSTYVPEPGESIELRCVPRPPPPARGTRR